jgi:DNA transformation protein and related proteins
LNGQARSRACEGVLFKIPTQSAALLSQRHPAPDMATQKETVEFLLAKLRQPKRFSACAMFGEYALYSDGKVVALICDNLLYVKILPASRELEPLCEKGEPYPGARPHYIVEEGQLSTLEALPRILCAIAESLPEKKGRMRQPTSKAK